MDGGQVESQMLKVENPRIVDAGCVTRETCCMMRESWSLLRVT
jgi:hypothetical protein